jgi:hypothetical protein
VHSLRKGKALPQRDEIGPLRLEDHPLSIKIQLIDDVVLETSADRLTTREKAAPDPIGLPTQAEVKARWLDVLVRDPKFSCVHDSVLDGPTEQLSW